MSRKTADRKPIRGEITTMMRRKAHRQAELAVALLPKKESMVDFISDAVSKRAEPILTRHGLDPENLPAKQ